MLKFISIHCGGRSTVQRTHTHTKRRGRAHIVRDMAIVAHLIIIIIWHEKCENEYILGRWYILSSARNGKNIIIELWATDAINSSHGRAIYEQQISLCIN